MVNSDTRRQLLRYGVVGAASNLFLYLAYLLLTVLGSGPKIAMSIVYVSGVAITFVANRAWSFNHRGMAHWSFVRYVIAYVLGYLLNLGLLWLCVDRMQLPHHVVQAAAIVVVALSLFLMHKYWVFVPAKLHRSEA